MMRILVLVIVLAAVGEAPGQELIQFNRDIRPILSDKCFFCHGPDSAKREANLRLDQRDIAIENGAISLSQPSNSELLTRVRSHDVDSQMPPPASKLGRLTEKEIETLERWIQQGAVYEGHWSFLPIAANRNDVNPPLSNPIDLHVRRELQRRGLVPQKRADPSTLLRRVHFDLTGLPPSLDAMQEFANSSSAVDYERVVDRLLQSDAFGERMAVDWLDISRYADSFGFQVDREWSMWRWRDWVVRALNENLPFDQFVTWQLAGDLLPNPTDDQLLATAYNRLHQQESEGGSVEEEYRVEYVCDRVQTFATTFLGLTFECARCHDHKFDPITQKEYYQFFSMFQNIDEAGLYSYFTESAPTPAMSIQSDQDKQTLAKLRSQCFDQEDELKKRKEDRLASFSDWYSDFQSDRKAGVNIREKLLAGLADTELGRFSMDSLEADKKLSNSVQQNKPASLKGDNRLVPGKFSQAVWFTGDDAVDLTIGNFARHEPFSISLWLQTPDEKERAVVLHRSRAWTDAASRGYELLIENGKLKWSLIHFWPGDAISIITNSKMETNQWTNVVVTYDGSSQARGLRIYVNGLLAPSQTVKDNLTRQITGGGGDSIALGERFRDRGFRGGMIDELRIFSREVSAIEVKALAEQEILEAVDEPTILDHYLISQDSVWKEQLDALKSRRSEYYKFADGLAEMMVMREMSQPKPAFVLARGEYNQPRDQVSPGTPKVLPPLPEGAPANRLGLAMWLTSPNHPLMARVTVNRIWQSFFGRGLVSTSEDFGSQGARPTYPEVLDGLAQEFIESKWNLKALVKSIVMSETYQQDSLAEPAIMTDDPDNLWLSRGPRFRLPAEMIRDNALSIAGLLDRTMGGKSVNPYEMSEAFKPVKPLADTSVYRRSLYTNWRRTGPPPAMVAFDAPRRQVCTAKRERTDSPLQALVLLNGTQYVEAARVCAEKLVREFSSDSEAMLRQAALLCLSRPPDSQELSILRRLYQEQRIYFQEKPEDAAKLVKIGNSLKDINLADVDVAAATILVQALMNHDVCVVKR